jgi:hypothetical protein
LAAEPSDPTQPFDELQVHDHHRPDRCGVLGRDVKSDHAPTASRDDGAVLVSKEVKAVDLGTGDRIAHRFVVRLRTTGNCSRGTFTHSGINRSFLSFQTDKKFAIAGKFETCPWNSKLVRSHPPPGAREPRPRLHRGGRTPLDCLSGATS